MLVTTPTLKYDPNGNLLWQEALQWAGKCCDRATAIAVDAAGNVYVTGYSAVGGTGFMRTDYATLKYDPNGNLQWKKRTNGAANSGERATSLALDSLGNVYVTGGSDLGYLTVKFSQ